MITKEQNLSKTLLDINTSELNLILFESFIITSLSSDKNKKNLYFLYLCGYHY